MYLILIYLGMLVIPLIASIKIRTTYNKYSEIECRKKSAGCEVADQILKDNGLSKIYIIESPGELSDCYDSSRKTVKLSTEVFHGSSISSVAVAAHECGHAIQDKEGYGWMRFRSAIFPIVSLSNKIAYITLILGFIFQVVDLIYLSIALTGVALFFQLVTLPVEFDASRRAKKILEDMGYNSKEEERGINAVLDAAAMTYVAGVLSTLLEMLYYLLATDRRR